MIKKQISNIKKPKSDVFIRFCSAVVFTVVLINSILINTDPVKNVIETSVGNVSDTKTVIIDAGHGGLTNTID